MNRLGIVTLITAFAGSVYAQTFEVASIREAGAAPAGIRPTITPSPGSLIIRNITLRDAIRWAFDEPGARIGVSGGPEWSDSIRYDIVARPAAASSNDQLRIMLRALLAERFKLVVRVERKESDVYFLTVDSKGHKLRPAKTDGPRSVGPDTIGLAFQNATMSDLQLFLTSLPGSNVPVVNRTGLEGAFDFKLALLSTEATEEGRKAATTGGGITAFADALAEVGLKLDRGKLPFDVVVVERVERPTEN
jgi:uncharacterized protein (TIGR03435 family)